eukprot:scaffold1828_cov98-Cylindrotheca_fusiformis.AAC.8
MPRENDLGRKNLEIIATRTIETHDRRFKLGVGTVPPKTSNVELKMLKVSELGPKPGSSRDPLPIKREFLDLVLFLFVGFASIAVSYHPAILK